MRIKCFVSHNRGQSSRQIMTATGANCSAITIQRQLRQKGSKIKSGCSVLVCFRHQKEARLRTAPNMGNREMVKSFVL